MVRPSYELPAHIDVRIGGDVHRALPVVLRGHEASVVMDEAPAERRELSLSVRWGDGRTTNLDARVRAVDGDGRIAHLDVTGVEGDWQPWLAYLGATRVG